MVYKLNVATRKIKGEVRPEGLIPAVIYGPEVEENVFLYVNSVQFMKLYEEAGESSLINLTVEGENEPREVLIKEIDRDPVKDKVLHIDFYQIKRGQKLEIEVELNFIGEAPAVKELAGVFVANLDSVKVRCMPKDMVSSVDVDLSQLKTFDDHIQVKDIKFPESVEILVDLDESVALVTPPRVEEAPDKPAEETTEGKEGEVKDGDKPAEASEEKTA